MGPLTQLFVGETILTVPSGSSTVSGSRIYAADGLQLAERTTTNDANDTLTYLDSDTQGTVTARISTTAAVTRQYHLPYGDTRTPTTTWASERGFLNQPINTETGLAHFGARDYDPANGRFTTVDPILAPYNPFQNNGYNYAANNPIANTDPDGKSFLSTISTLLQAIAHVVAAVTHVAKKVAAQLPLNPFNFFGKHRAVQDYASHDIAQAVRSTYSDTNPNVATE